MYDSKSQHNKSWEKELFLFAIKSHAESANQLALYVTEFNDFPVQTGARLQTFHS